MRPTTRRAAEVATVLARHGLGSMVDFLELHGTRRSRKRRAAAPPRRVGPAHLRHALEELGPAFVKLGQVLSTRPDLVPPEYETELSILQDAAPAAPTREIMRVIEDALQQPIREAYARFDGAPLAAASIGQVHAATLPDGTDVVVKVRRPGVTETIDLDLAVLARVAATAARRPALERYDPVGLANEFDTTLRGELDYLREARSAEAARTAFDGDAKVHVPRIFWSHTRDGVITEERIRGCKIDDFETLDADGADRALLARTFADAYLAMIFVHRFFHADPHPGNVFVEADDRVAFVDFGMVGEVTSTTVHGLGTMLLAVVTVDASQMADGLLQLGVASEHVDRPSLETDLVRFLHEYTHVPLEQLRIGPLLNEVMGVVRAHQLRLPSDLALLIKTMMMCEGVAASLDPGFELVPMLLPYAARLTGDTGPAPSP